MFKQQQSKKYIPNIQLNQSNSSNDSVSDKIQEKFKYQIIQFQDEQDQVQYQKCLFCLTMIESDIFTYHKAECQQTYKKLAEDLEFKTCIYCSIKLLKREINEHQEICAQQELYCTYCGQLIINLTKQKHFKTCPGRLWLEKSNKKKETHQKVYQEDQFKSTLGHCKWCDEHIRNQSKDSHEFCIKRLMIQQELEKCHLTVTQHKAINQMFRKSSYEHSKLIQRMKKTAKKMGYDQGDLLLMQQYIEHQAPLIIHINLSKVIQNLNRDTQYRNLFQTKKSGGSNNINNRKMWENYLFGPVYDNCKDSERVKYGVINFANDKNGIAKCQGYGMSTILLKQHVRKRCTISHNRKYAPGEIVATLKYCYPVLSLFSSGELHTLHLASRGFQVDSSDLHTFKEIHIHGPINIAEDIECIYTTRSERQKLRKDVTMFEAKFGVKIIPVQDFLQKA